MIKKIKDTSSKSKLNVIIPKIIPCLEYFGFLVFLTVVAPKTIATIAAGKDSKLIPGITKPINEPMPSHLPRGHFFQFLNLPQFG